ncbi:MAG TPA: nitrogenase molybdenum-iron protein alpha chain [Lentisphaeria bacterium]|nr:MAG: nitrogenase molybdenum-iron protein alpha chain [Lentisphaerae bacterium GWF2_50_93]HCE43492.1 nitrogenase molybdenum-iron protein alpha chain [Lentisphaeria bacterium]
MKTYPTTEAVRDELVKSYPAKVAKKRLGQIVVNKKDEAGLVPEIKANSRSIPGIISQRGCCYAGCKGVVLGPTRDIINLVHGPIGCSFYAWLTRRNQTRPEGSESENYMTYCFSTDIKDENIVFGGEKKLRKAIQEAYDLFHPKAIGVFATCPVGLIGDDIHTVAREMKEKFGDCNVFGFSCEGYKGVSQSAGHHIANNQLFKHVIGLNDQPPEGKFKVTLLGEYNIGGDSFILEEIFEKCGMTLVATLSGNSTIAQFERAHTADLNCVMCHRSINYIADMIEKKYGVPWFKVNFIGAKATAKSLRKIADYFEDAGLKEKVEKLIAEEMAEVEKVAADVRTRCEGKTAMLFVGGSRAHHYQELFAEIGMKTLAAGYEFAHRDDYEGRNVLPKIKVDADSRNIEELDVKADPVKFRQRATPEEMTSRGVPHRDYDGMMPEMENNALVVDDISEHETEELLRIYKPDIFCAGIKEKYGIQKNGIPCKQLHNYDYGGPYAGFKGAINFYLEIDRMVNASVWKMISPPWRKNDMPELEADYVKT